MGADDLRIDYETEIEAGNPHTYIHIMVTQWFIPMVPHRVANRDLNIRGSSVSASKFEVF